MQRIIASTLFSVLALSSCVTSAQVSKTADAAKELALAEFLQAIEIEKMIQQQLDAALADLNLDQAEDSMATVAAALGGSAVGNGKLAGQSLKELRSSMQSMIDSSQLASEIYAPFYRKHFASTELKTFANYATQRKQLLGLKNSQKHIQLLDQAFWKTEVAGKFLRLLPEQQALDSALLKRLQQTIGKGQLGSLSDALK